MHRFIALLTLILSGICHAQTFWQGTAYGDTVEQVLAKVAAAGEPQRSEELRRKDISTLISAPVVLAEKQFDANFYFSSAGLDRVILIKRELSSAAEADATNTALIQALRLKFGRSTKSEDVRRAILEDKALSFMWASGDTDILLVPQHHSQNMMIAYTLSERGKERADAKAARDYSKKINPKKEAEKL